MNSFKKILRTPTAFVVVLAAILTLIGVIYKSNSDANIARFPIDATETAEARLTALAIAIPPTAHNPTPSLAISNPTATAQPSNSIIIGDDASGNTVIQDSNVTINQIPATYEGPVTVVVKPWLEFSNSVYQVGWTTDGATLATIDSGTLRLWRVSDKKLLHSIEVSGDAINCFSISPDGKTIATGMWWGGIYTWNISDGTYKDAIRRTTNGGAASMDRVITLAFSSDGKYIFAGDDFPNNTASMWDVANKKLVWQFTGHTDDVAGIAVNPQNTILATGSKDGKVFLWDIQTGKLTRTINPSASVYDATFTSDGNTLITAGGGGSIQIWNVSNGRLIKTLEGHLDKVLSIDITKDDLLLASGSRDTTIIIWDLTSGNIIQQFRKHTKSVTSVSFSPSGMFLASGSLDESVEMWDLR